MPATALPARYLGALRRYRYGPGVFKIDYALDGPIPWRAAECSRAATVHVGGTLEEIALSERTVWRGGHAERPFVLLVQSSLFDPSRAPAGRHTAWAYCHVPNGSTVDMTAAIEKQIERFAPGFRERILARHTMHAKAMEQYNPNYVGGDINSGVQDLFQQFTRPAMRLIPYSTPNPRFISARLPHLQAEACMACAAIWLRRRPCVGRRQASDGGQASKVRPGERALTAASDDGRIATSSLMHTPSVEGPPCATDNSQTISHRTRDHLGARANLHFCEDPL